MHENQKNHLWRLCQNASGIAERFPDPSFVLKLCVCVCFEGSMQAAVKAAKGINYALAMSESCLKASTRSNPHFLGYRHFVVTTRVAFTHVEAVFPRVPAGDSQLFNVPACIELFTGVLCFYRCQAAYPPKQEQGSHTTKVCSSFKKLNLAHLVKLLYLTRCARTYSQRPCYLTSTQFPFGVCGCVTPTTQA